MDVTSKDVGRRARFNMIALSLSSFFFCNAHVLIIMVYL